MVVRPSKKGKMIDDQRPIVYDHIDRMLLELIRGHPDIRLADVQHSCPLSGPATIHRLLKLSEGGLVSCTRDIHRVTTYRIAPANENIKNESAATTAPKQGETNNARIIP